MKYAWILVRVALVAALSLGARQGAAQTTIASVFRSGELDANGIPISQMREIAAVRSRTAVFRGHTDALMQWDGVSYTVRLQTRAPLPAPLAGSFNIFFDPVINDAGDIVFRSTLNSTTTDEGFFVLTAAGATLHVNAGIIGRPERSTSDINNSQEVVWLNRDPGTGRSLYRWALGVSTLIATRGGAAPGGGTWDRFPDHPVISDSGHVAFVAELQGGSDGVFLWDPTTQTITAIAQTGNPTPSPGVTYGTFRFSQAVAISPSGDIVFTAPLVGGSAADGVFVYRQATGSVSLVATDGMLAFGVGALIAIHDDYAGANGAGELAFKAEVAAGFNQLILVNAVGALSALSPPFAPSNNHFAPRLTSSRDTVWEAGIGIDMTDTPASLITVVDRRTVTPIGLDVITRTPSINNAGVVVFQGDHRQLYVIDGGLPAGRVQAGAPSPRGGGTMTTVVWEHAMHGKSIAFLVGDDGTCPGGGPVGCVPHAIGWTRTNNPTVARVVASGDAAPASIGGLIALPNPGPVAVKSGMVWFMSPIAGGSIPEALFRVRRPGRPPEVFVGSGDPVPGRPLVFDSFQTFKQMKANGSYLVFQADTTPFAEGIFRYRTRGGGGVTVALSGDPAPGTLSFFESFGRMALNRQGDIAFTASLVNGARGLFLWIGRSQTITRIALDGDATPLGGVYDFQDYTSMPLGIGRQRLIVFAALSVGPLNFDALYRVDAGVVSVVAAQGDPALSGGFFRGFNLASTMQLDNRFGMATHQLSLDGAEYELQGLLFQ